MDRHQWDERYRAEELVWRAEPNRFLVSEVAGLTPGRALDLACGEGRNALWLAKQGWSVTAVDFSAVGLAKARRLATERHLQVDLVEGDVLQWQAPAGAFDLVVVMYLQLPPAQRRRVVQLAATASARGGTVLVVGHDSSNLTEGYGGPQDPAVLYSPEDIVADLADVAGRGDPASPYKFDVVRAERARRPVVNEQGTFEAIDAIVRAVRAA